MAIDWPTLADLKRKLDVESEDWDGTTSGDDNVTDLSLVLADAIAETKARIGNWVEESDVPDEGMALSALDLACEMLGRPQIRSKSRLYGKRRRFGTA